MNSDLSLLIVYCLLILLASLAGGWIPLWVRLTHSRMELASSFVAGLMLGVALLHMLPHALVEMGPDGSFDQITAWLLVGFLMMFFVERFFCFHHHEVPDADGARAAQPAAPHGHELTWTGAAIGLSVHSVIAGVALGASVKASNQGVALAGLGTFLAIVLHKPFDSMTLGALMAVGRRSMRARHLVNGLFGLVVPLGVALFYLGVGGDGGLGPGVISGALAFSAGTFLCISLSDLLPELQFHQHDRFKLSAALLLGLALAWGAGRLEGAVAM